MPKILKKILLGVGAFLTLLLAIFVVYEIVFAIFGGLTIADGPLTKGDILTSVSIAVAALGAIGGWVLTSQHRQDDIERLTMDEREKIVALTAIAGEEAKRIAEADAIILYRRLESVESYIMALLLNLVAPGDRGLAIRFAKAKNSNDVKADYRRLEIWSNEFLPHIPDTDEHLNALRSLYVHKQELGDKFGTTLRRVLRLRADLNYYANRPLATMLTRFEAMPNIEKQYIFGLLTHAASFLIDMELCRRALKNVEFQPPLFNSDLIELKEMLEQIHGKKIVMENKTARIGEGVYLQIFEAARDYFTKMSFEFGSGNASDEK